MQEQWEGERKRVEKVIIEIDKKKKNKGWGDIGGG